MVGGGWWWVVVLGGRCWVVCDNVTMSCHKTVDNDQQIVDNEYLKLNQLIAGTYHTTNYIR